LLAVLPILTMIVMSFRGASNLDFPPSSYSLLWYKAAWNTFVSPDASDVLSLGQAMTTSLGVACLTMVLATLVAVPAS
ncbi:ABC transporter permease, partial [Pseudomonas sp. 10C3]|nr:ABC transporter permease [Pseudomonas sp. 10C3]